VFFIGAKLLTNVVVIEWARYPNGVSAVGS